MKKIIRLTESDLTRIVKRVIRENNDYKNIETSGNEDWKSKLKSYESKMDDFLRQLKDSGTEIDKKRFLTQIQNQTDQMYWDVYDNSDSEPEGFVELQMNLMKRFRQKLNESDLARIVKRVIKENELNMVNETSIMSRIQYNKQIRDAKNQAKENDECMCVVETIVSGVIVKPCDDLTPTEEEHIIFYTKNCGDSFEDDDEM